MTRELIVVRHAKSSWRDSTLLDHDRPLNERGKRDAPKMSEYVLGKIDPPELIMTSTAVRTLSTAKCFLQSWNLNQDQMIETRSLYHASSLKVYEMLASITSNIKSVMVVGHNPGLTDFINQIGDHTIINLPTCGVGLIELDIHSWDQINYSKGYLKKYFYPKGI